MDILSVQQLLLDTPTGGTSLPLGLQSGSGQGAGVQKPRPRLNVQKAVEYSVGGESPSQLPICVCLVFHLHCSAAAVFNKLSDLVVLN